MKSEIVPSRIIKKYITITFSIIIAMTIMIVALNIFGISIYGTWLGFVAIAVGGLSSAFAGAITAKGSGKVHNYRTILVEFFRIKQSVSAYLLIILFLILIFGSRIASGGFVEGRQWNELPILFVSAILFGGVEEIGWRYLFQPILEKRFSFWLSSCITFVMWSVWHMMYFIIDGSIRFMDIWDILLFLIGLLGTSFILGCIYRITNSLWLCVFYHALLNALMQIVIGVDVVGTIVIAIVSITLSVLMTKMSKNIP